MLDEDKEISPADEYKDTNLTLRHYSNMRFIHVGLFLSINGALLLGLDRFPRIISAATITIVWVFFCFFETILNLYVEAFRRHAIKLFAGSYWAKRPLGRWPSLVTSLILAFYTTIVLFWWVLVAYPPMAPSKPAKTAELISTCFS